MPLNDIETWVYHLGDVSAARARAIGASNADLVVTEWADYSRGEAPYDAAHLDLMRGAQGDKTVLSYLSIGEAEPYRYYWDPAWETPEGRPDWIGEANPEWVDNIRVRFWQDDWQQIVFDYAERIVTAGFDGLYLDIVSAYEFWEKRDRAPGIDLRAEMADFVADLRARVDAAAPGREIAIIGQNALELIEESAYLDAIDGIAKEDLRFYYTYGNPQEFGPWPGDEYRYHRDLLVQAEAAGKATFVVEYIPDGTPLDGRHGALLAAEAADLGGIGSPLFIAVDRDLTGLPAQPAQADTGVFPLFDPSSPPLGLRGTGAADTLTGGAGGEAITGLGGSDLLRGRGGADTIEGGAGHDQIFGGGGADLLRGGTGLDELSGGAGGDRLIGGAQADLLRGNGGGDQLEGGRGPDELFGGAGPDRLTGGRGGDLLTGGPGRDVFVFAAGEGEDQIGDFDIARDRLDLNGTYTVLQLRAGAYLAFDDGGGVLLEGVAATAVTADLIV